MGSNVALDDAQIAIIGRACRLPGAATVEALWALLRDGRCAVSEIPSDRWPLSRHGHPRVREPGRSYTWAAGVLPDIWGFDPNVFRISPREAQQIDPQQRLLLELAFEACEDGGFAPSELAGSETGVYVGASALDYSTIGLHDPAVADAYYATGNTLSIVSNRLSYIFDLHGPSLTIDTACSSSLVALHEARHALARGEIETALVGGVSILASPFGFISFSQATMLSPTGLCRAFSAEADGYVRAEGGVVLVLKTLKKAVADGDRIHAVLCGSAVNSDGRTSGISLPAEKYQTELLAKIYGRGGVSPDSVAYVEAHGTGTRVGDPIEAASLGAVLGRARRDPLPIGSIKSNIGHTEPASGLAGLLKAMLALEHDEAPKSLHCDNPNPLIDFARLNLQVAREPIALPRTLGPRFAGVSSFGFGGAGAHVVIGDPPVARSSIEAAPRLMMLSAQTEEALRALAAVYAERLEGADPREVRRIVAATGRRRERMRDRLVLPAEEGPRLSAALRAFAQSGETGRGSTKGSAVEGDRSIVFVFSGNGSQWPGMGRAAWRASAAFREAFAEVDSIFAPLAGWSLVEELNAPDMASDLTHTHIAQPMIFAIQAASVRALAAAGVLPSLTMGHSVGEVAAVEAAGILSLPAAVRVIYHRSRLQQATENAGGMAVIFGARDAAVELVGRVPDLAVAAHNSHHCIAVAGPQQALDRLLRAAAAQKLRARRLDLPYPFHTELMAPVKKPLIENLAGVTPSEGSVPFLSTIADGLMPGGAATAEYWWRNIRQVVLFQEGVERALHMGKRVFLEVGPRPTLKTHIRDTADHLDMRALVDCVLGEKGSNVDVDPFEAAAARLLASGAGVRSDWAFGPDPGPGIDLPAYPWRRTAYRFPETTESTGQLDLRPRHPLIGARETDGALEWRTVLDPALEPALADHQVDGQILLPGAAFVEMGLAVARDWAGPEAALSGFEILQPLVFAPEASREILCRVSPSTATVEIMSRPRLARTAYATHARGKIIEKPGPVPVVPPPFDGAGEAVEAGALYARAGGAGLEFGPAFRCLARAVRPDHATIAVTLAPGRGDARYGLDPARFDSCLHGLITLFAGDEGENGAYLPVRFEEVRLVRPGAGLSRGSIRVRRRDDRIIVADLDLFDGEGRLAALLRGARFQALRPRTSPGFAELGLIPYWIPATEDVSGGAPRRTWPQGFGLEPAKEAELPSAPLLLEGWATSACYALALSLASGEIVDVDALVDAGRLPPDRRRWAETIFKALEQSGLLERSGAVWRLNACDMPEPAAVFSAIASRHPERAPELLLAAAAGAALTALSEGAGEPATPSDGAVEGFELRSASAIAAARVLDESLEAIARAAGDDKVALRLLQVGAGPANAATLRFAASRKARVTVLDADARRLERLRLQREEASEVSFAGDLDALPDAGFDLVVSAGGLSRLIAEPDAWARLARKCAEGARVVAVEPMPSLFRDLTIGLAERSNGAPRERTLGAEAWQRECGGFGFQEVDARLVDTGADHAVFLAASAPERAPASQPAERGAIFLLRDGADGEGFADKVRSAVEARGWSCRSAEDATQRKAGHPQTIVWLACAHEGDAATRVALPCLRLRDIVQNAQAKAKVFVVAPAGNRPVAQALFSFVRTLANEFPALDFRRIEVAATATGALRLAAIVVSETAETDFLIDDEGVQVLRYGTPKDDSGDAASGIGLACRLEKSPEGGLDRLGWRPGRRKAPGPNEVEVEVVATGLNFRDVMWALSILPDEMLEDGFAGPALGLEFAGRVVRAGAAVAGLKPGDEVLGLCGGAFATHAVVDAAHVARVPSGLSCESAATLPVAFLTAYYGLVSCAGLQRGEWVLIHGGAGGVGLAALQIVLWRGARAIVTAGSPEKRALTLALGAEYAFDSRSGGFVDDVMRVTGGRGVSVALNSLSGEAMERSLGLLQPFGRFVELGKRDYLANTAVGLRPFRRNLSYFGIDLDQLLSARPDVSRRLFESVLALFAAGDLRPLPYTVFARDDVVEAMRLMQQSGHIGKILVRPPLARDIRLPPRPAEAFAADPERTHLITGGLGGFGLAAAEWLAGRGARHLALVGRSGAASDLARETVARLLDRGVQVRVASLDVADRSATERFLTDLARSMPPLAGVMHAAMVLDDAIAANLDRARFLEVLRPKVAGAETLDRLTRRLPLDYFVLFSSATTVIGNPGQGAYVAANGFLEGLARERRAAGLPALAVAWGAIADVGVVARRGATRDSLAQRAGVKGLEARAALDALGEALVRPEGEACVVIADVNWATARAHLALLNSPTYARLASGTCASDAAADGVVDLRDLVARVGPDQARRAVVDILVDEIGRILRLPRDDVSRTKPLAEIGLDSLMAVELMLSIETRFGMDTPLGSSAGGFNVADLAGHLLAARMQDGEPFDIAEDLAKRHLGKSEWDQIAPLMTALQDKGVDLTPAPSSHAASV